MIITKTIHNNNRFNNCGRDNDKNRTDHTDIQKHKNNYE
jgi:hypothetical protein